MLRAITLVMLASANLAIAAAPPPDARRAAWDALDVSLNEGSSERRQQGLAALSTIGSPDEDAVKRAATALKDKDPLVRQAAALALGELKAESAIPQLKQALEDSPEVSFAAAKALTRIGDPSGRDVLAAVLAGERKDAPGMMTNAIRKAKDKLHHPEGLVLMGAQDATGAMFGPVSMVIPAVKDTAEMKSKGAPGRAAAAAYLAKYPDPYAITLLEWALGDENQFVRLEAARGLGERGNSESIPKLQALLDDPHNIVRAMAAASAIRILDRNAAPGEVSQGSVVPAAPPKK